MSRLAQIAYPLRFYGALRRVTRLHHRDRDMADHPFPRVVQLQTINACQAACTMCPYPLFKDVFARGRMEDGLFEKVLDEIAGRPEAAVFVPMLQNEPLLDRRLFDRIAAVKARTGGRMEVELVTNGALLTDEVVERVRETRLDYLDVSLDALSRETYGRIRIGLDYDDVIAGVERVMAADLPDTTIVLRLVRQRENAAEVAAFVRHWRARGAVVFTHTVNNRVGSVPGYDERIRIPDREIPVLQKAGRRVFRRWLGCCPVPFASANILHNGDVLLCVQDWARKEVLGNVREATIAEIWNGARMREIRALVRDRRYEEVPTCRDCSLWKDGWV
ncbi:MAG TPA: radical SAM protein [Longimicrobiales bacterium]|nr:radical SAM protein [Longimicrobiales bacterium]